MHSRSPRNLALAAATFALVACEKKAEPPPAAEPKAEQTEAKEPSVVDKALDRPAEGTPEYSLAKLDDDQKKVIEALVALGGKPIETLTPEQARHQPAPTDAVKKVLTDDGKPVTPEDVARTEDKEIPIAGAKLPVRIYTPKEGKAPYPAVLYFHGGGWVIASNDVYDGSARALANASEAVVVAVDYRLAPEHKFPTAHDDAIAAYQWLLKSAKSLKIDAKKIAVAGESAGGNLAANVAIAARDKKLPAPVHMLLVYPVASSSLDSESFREHAQAKPLSKAMMPWFTKQYFRSEADGQDIRINLVNADLKGLPSATVINAEVDPLRAGGQELAKKLEAAGVDTKEKTYEGVAHEFFGQGAAVGDAKEAVKLAGSRLRDAFEN